MIATFTTVFSTYQIDTQRKRIRRLVGVRQPTPRQGTDGEWREYHEVTLLANNSLLIVWDSEGRATITSALTGPVPTGIPQVEHSSP